MYWILKISHWKTESEHLHGVLLQLPAFRDVRDPKCGESGDIRWRHPIRVRNENQQYNKNNVIICFTGSLFGNCYNLCVDDDRYISYAMDSRWKNMMWPTLLVISVAPLPGKSPMEVPASETILTGAFYVGLLDGLLGVAGMMTLLVILDHSRKCPA